MCGREVQGMDLGTRIDLYNMEIPIHTSTHGGRRTGPRRQSTSLVYPGYVWYGCYPIRGCVLPFVPFPAETRRIARVRLVRRSPCYTPWCYEHSSVPHPIPPRSCSPSAFPSSPHMHKTTYITLFLALSPINLPLFHFPPRSSRTLVFFLLFFLGPKLKIRKTLRGRFRTAAPLPRGNRREIDRKQKKRATKFPFQKSNVLYISRTSSSQVPESTCFLSP